MATAGLDSRVKIWDLRTYKELQNYLSPTPAASLSISQKGLLAVGFGPHVNVIIKFKIYMNVIINQ